MNTEKRKIKWDIIMILAILAVAMIIAAILLLTSTDGNTVQVSVDGNIVASFPLNKDCSYTINSAGGRNLLIIQEGKAWISEADCPDILCVNMGKISKAGQSIICLPHKVVVEIAGNESNDIDVIAE